MSSIPLSFEYQYYLSRYLDLRPLKTAQKAWEHWNHHGKNEGRTYIPDFFDWRAYREAYPDLHHLTTQEELWNHWTEYGEREGRKFFPPIYIFYSLCVINDKWREIFGRQMSYLSKFNLLSYINRIHIVQIGDGDVNLNFIPSKVKEKINILKKVPNSCEESGTLEELWKLSQKEDFYVLYFHTKGISHQGQMYCRVTDWAKMMEYFLIERYSCLDFLPSYDALGCNLTERPLRHFSGNFWWSKASYLRTLPDPLDPHWLGFYNEFFDQADVNQSVEVLKKMVPRVEYNEEEHRFLNRNNSGNFQNLYDYYLQRKRYNNEFWIGRKNDSKFLSLHDSGFLHYSRPYPECFYKKYKP